MFPMTGERVATLSEEEEEQIDAYLLRFNSLITIFQESLFKGILILESEDPSNKSAKDKSNLMEKLGVISSAAEFSSMAVLRNKLTHSYPDNPEKQAEVVSKAWEFGLEALKIFNSLIHHVRTKNLLSDLEDMSVEIRTGSSVISHP